MEDIRFNVIYGYCRVSSEDQKRYGHSLEEQEEAIREYAKRREHKELIICKGDAGISGRAESLEKRLDLKRILDNIKENDAIVVRSMDRLTRSLINLLHFSEIFEKKGAHIVLIDINIDTSTAIGKVFFRIMGMLAEFESEQLSKRILVNMADMRKKGMMTGRPRYGWRVDVDPKDEKKKQYVKDENEQKVIEKIIHWRDFNGWSIDKIISKLKAEEVPAGKVNKKGNVGKWTKSRVSRIYTAEMAYREKEKKKGEEKEKGSEEKKNKEVKDEKDRSLPILERKPEQNHVSEKKEESKPAGNVSENKKVEISSVIKIALKKEDEKEKKDKKNSRLKVQKSEKESSTGSDSSDITSSTDESEEKRKKEKRKKKKEKERKKKHKKRREKKEKSEIPPDNTAAAAAPNLK